MKRIILSSFVLLSALLQPCYGQSEAAKTDVSKPRVAFGAAYGRGIVLGSSDFGGGIVHENPLSYYNVYARWQAGKDNCNNSDLLFGKPTLEAGFLMIDYSKVVLHQGKTEYNSNTGKGLVAYLGFRRDLLRKHGFHLGYQFQNGVGYCTRPYSIIDNKDNHLIGTHWNIYFGFSAYASYLITPHLEIGVDADAKHLSNGSMQRPNKGANSVAASFHLTYHLNEPERQLKAVRYLAKPLEFKRRFYIDAILGIGQKSLNDEWIYRVRKYDGNAEGNLYCDEYAVYSLSLAPMYRYSSRYAVGIGIDAQYSKAAEALMKYEGLLHNRDANPSDNKMLGISVRHEVFWRQMSIPYSVGVYLHEEGYLNGDEVKKPWYETIGIRWNPSFLPNFYVGYNVRAHALIADHMAIQVGYRI